MPIKVLHLISNKAGIGGAEKFLLDISEGFDRERFSVSYCAVFSEGDNILSDEIRKRDSECLEIIGTKSTNFPRVIQKLVSLMRREKFDIVHTQLLHGSIAGQIAARIAGVPIRIITRQYTTDCYRDTHKYLDKLDAYTARKATKVIAISKAVKENLIEQGVKPENIELIYNGIDLKPFNRKNASHPIRKSFPNKYLIAFVANLNYRKGHEYLLEAMSQLALDFNDIHLLLVGEGELRSDLEELTAKLNIKDKVSFMGYQPDVPGLLNEVDLYVHASTLEPLGIAVLEAMAAGKCVVATKVGGVPEIVKDGRTGILVPSKDAAALANAIRYLKNNSLLASEMGNAGRNLVERVFDIREVAKKYQDVYESSIKRSLNINEFRREPSI